MSRRIRASVGSRVRTVTRHQFKEGSVRSSHLVAATVLTAFVVGGGLWASRHFHVIRLPGGAIKLARSHEVVGAGGKRYRPYIVGVDGIVRTDFDEDQDGNADLRCDGPREGTYTACSIATHEGGRECPISRCERAWKDVRGEASSDLGVPP